MAENRKEYRAWIRLLMQRPWHFWMRVLALLMLGDQAAGTITALPKSEAVIIVLLGALFAPIPVERRRKDREKEQ